MKKHVLNILTLMVLLCSCSDEEPYRMPLEEFPPIKLYFSIVNERGEDLLNPENPNNVLHGDISVVFKDVEYKLDLNPEKNPNGDKSPIDFKGLRKSGIYQDKYVLSFGELDGSLYYKDECVDFKCFAADVGCVISTGFEIYSIWTYNENGYPDFYRYYTRARQPVELENPSTNTPVFVIVPKSGVIMH